MKHETLHLPVRPDAAASMPVYNAESLTRGGRKAVIILGDQHYTLQITKQGKLLLTK